jgi:HPt (histidine-containing phosphotransfer) domain-containing protein
MCHRNVQTEREAARIAGETRPQGSFEDFQELLRQVDNDRELVLEMVGLFKSEFPRLDESLRDAVARVDLKLLGIASHTAKGMLASLAFKHASASAAELEVMAKQGATEGLQEKLAQLEQQAITALAELEVFCGAGSP